MHSAVCVLFCLELRVQVQKLCFSQDALRDCVVDFLSFRSMRVCFELFFLSHYASVVRFFFFSQYARLS